MAIISWLLHVRGVCPCSSCLAGVIDRDVRRTYDLLRRMERRGLLLRLSRIGYGGITHWVPLKRGRDLLETSEE